MSDFKHLEDKRVCPHCGKALHTRRYLMTRDRTEYALSTTQIAWIVCFAVLLLVLVNLPA
jgi:hypothetical protein